MSDYNKALHHDDHHETIDRLREAARLYRETAQLQEAELARVRGQYEGAIEEYHKAAEEQARLRAGHRICEENMDAEIDRLREIVERYERDYGRYPEVR